MTKLGLVMDPINAINIRKDSTFAMALAAQSRGWQLSYMELGDLYLRDGKSAYLSDLPLVIRYSLEVAQDYPETRPFYEWFCSRFSDVLMAQSWYRDWRKAGEL